MTTRRDFLHRAGACGLAVACGSLIMPREIAALPVSSVDGAGDDAEKRYPIPVADGVVFDRLAGLYLVRLQGHAFALKLACPHQEAAVKWVDKHGAFECTKHNSRYKPDGTYIAGKSTRSLDRFAIRRDGANLVVDLGQVIRIDQDPAGWAAAVVAV